jgi:hypothetical protein
LSIDTPVTGTTSPTTFTSQVALTDPAFAVIVVCPSLTPVTTPFWSTFAIEGSFDDQTTSSVVPVGVTVAFNSAVALTLTVMFFSLSTISVAGTASFTVILQLALAAELLADVAVIVAVPAAFAVTTPSLTSATAVLSDVHVTFLFVAFAGNTVSFKVNVSPTTSSLLVSLRDTLLTATVPAVTVTVHLAFLSSAVAVIVALPAFMPLTTPLELTVAIFFV